MRKQFAVLNGSINMHILFGFYVHLTLTGMFTKIFPIMFLRILLKFLSNGEYTVLIDKCFSVVLTARRVIIKQQKHNF